MTYTSSFGVSSNETGQTRNQSRALHEEAPGPGVEAAGQEPRVRNLGRVLSTEPFEPGFCSLEVPVESPWPLRRIQAPPPGYPGLR